MTIAYSEKYQTWVSRYSFEPTCYSTIGESMISFNDNGNVWTHDTNEVRCNFYENQEETSIEVCSNQDPSAIKIFKSISLETNATGWEGTVYTNDEYEGIERQEGSILNSFFKNKEGFKYAEMPRSKINSSTSIPAGILGEFQAQVAQVDDYEALDNTLIGYFISNYTLTNGVLSDSAGNEVGADSFEFVLPGSFMPDLIQPNSIVSVLKNESITELSRIKFVSATQNEITLSCSYTLDEPNESDSFYFSQSQLPNFPSEELIEYLGDNLYQIESVGEGNFEQLTSNYPLFSVQEAEINGDQMRGPYVRARLSTETSGLVELHAINVDYEFSKLDKRLTQNP